MNEGCMPVQCPDWEIYLLLHDQNPPIIRSNVLGFLFFVHRLKIISFPFLCVVFCMYNSTMYIVHVHSNWSLQLNNSQFIFSQYERRQISSYLSRRSVSGSVTIGQSGCMTVWPLLCSCVNQDFDLSYLPPILPNWRNCYCKLPFRKLMGTAS